MPHSKSTAERGYGTDHQRLRRSWAPRVAAGLVNCWRCGRRIKVGEAWDLGHDDHDRRKYMGPEHRDENRAAAARKTNRIRRGAASQQPPRVWPF